MPRILYLLPGQGKIQGGYKVIVRHVEALRELGFDAFLAQGIHHKKPTWLDHTAPYADPLPLFDDDIIVAPDDATEALRWLASRDHKSVVLTQNPFYAALLGFSAIDTFPQGRLPTFMAVSQGLRATINRVYPDAPVEVVPCFADERIFRPGQSKQFSVAYSPKKRDLEAKIIREFFRKLAPRHADLQWVNITGMREPTVASMLGQSSLLLSLSRLESVGMTTLEGMACGCLCAGFTGVGGNEYATAENGLWVPDDDCEAAADALARAADILKEGSADVERLRAGGFRTAEQWSYLRFREALEQAWMRIAPEARAL